MKYYGFGTVTRHADEFISSYDNKQGHSTTVKKRHDRQLKSSARQAAKRQIRVAIDNLNHDFVQTHATSRQRKKAAEWKIQRIAKQEQWQRRQEFLQTDRYAHIKAHFDELKTRNAHG